MRLKDKVAFAVGGGQTTGETIGNDRATSIRFAREGAAAFVADRDPESAAATVKVIGAKGGSALALSAENASYGVRVNAILPGHMDTSMVIERRARERSVSRQAVPDERDVRVTTGKLGTAWGVAAAAVFLASNEAGYLTGVLLAINGGPSARVG